MDETDASEDWSTYEDVGDLMEAADGRDPVMYPHALLLQDPPIMFSWAWYWFSSPEERAAWIVRYLEIEEHPDTDDYTPILERLRQIGEGPAGADVLKLSVGGAEASWVGTLEQLCASEDPAARKCRFDFWEGRDDGEDETAEEDWWRPIPDSLVEDFIDSLSQN